MSNNYEAMVPENARPVSSASSVSRYDADGFVTPNDAPPSPIPDQRRFFGNTVEPNQRDSLLSGLSSSTPLGSLPGDSAASLHHPAEPYHDDSPSLRGQDAFDHHDRESAAAEKRDRMLQTYAAAGSTNKNRRRYLLIAIGGLIAAIVIALAVALPVTLTKKNHDDSKPVDNGGSNDGGSNDGNGSGNNNSTGNGGQTLPVSGGDGSTITMEDGTTFIYSNKFGGTWVDDPDQPLSNNAQAQSWVPPLNQSWGWGKDRIFGVNLGGWLNTEPFITPALYEKYPGTVDEWTLSLAMANDTANGGLATIMENHYKTFITEQDFAEIAGAGLSWVRIPLPAWAIETRDNEPFLEGVAWQYFLKAIKWARKYGLRINLDLHTMPGSQNGYNHSGKLGSINFLNGTMGLANAQRGLEYIRILTEFISQPEYSNIVPMFGIMNEAVLQTISKDILSHFYLEAHDMMRNITGYGTGNGAYIAIHDGFQGTNSWSGYMSGADRLILDSHPYFCFTTQDGSPLANQVNKPCTAWASSFNSSMSNFGITIAGEWSLGFNDCGKWLNGVNSGTRWEGTWFGSNEVYGNCKDWTNWPAWSQSTRKSFKQFAYSSMDALPNWFFWTWKIGNSSVTGKVEAPMWSYQLGLDQGWIPSDPRGSVGSCKAAGVNSPAKPLKPTQTGGGAAGTIVPSFRAEYSAWPPASLASVPNAQNLPTYTPTGAVPTLPVPTYTQRDGTKVSTGNGWFDAQDTAQAPVAIQGCTYPNAWNAVGVPVPTQPFCSSGNRRRSPQPTVIPSS